MLQLRPLVAPQTPPLLCPHASCRIQPVTLVLSPAERPGSLRMGSRAQCCTYTWWPSQATCYIRGSPLIRSPGRRDLQAPVQTAQALRPHLASTAALQLMAPEVRHHRSHVLCVWTSTAVGVSAGRLLAAFWTYSRSQCSHFSVRLVFQRSLELRKQLHREPPLLSLSAKPPWFLTGTAQTLQAVVLNHGHSLQLRHQQNFGPAPNTMGSRASLQEIWHQATKRLPSPSFTLRYKASNVISDFTFWSNLALCSGQRHE